MIEKPGLTINFTPQEIVSIDPDATEGLVEATTRLLAVHGYPVSIELVVPKPLPRRGGLDARVYKAMRVGGIYLVEASLTSTTVVHQRPVINRAVFMHSVQDPILDPEEDLITLQRGFAVRNGGTTLSQMHPDQTSPEAAVEELGYSVSRLALGQDVLPSEYWLIADQIPRAQ